MKASDYVMEFFSLRLPFSGRKGHMKVMRENFQGVKTILDVGCGAGVLPIYQDYNSTGVDIFEVDLKRAERLGHYKKLVQGDVRQLPFTDKSFDAVTAIEIIEHLKKEEGYQLLDKIEKIARKVVVITTPWGEDLLPKRKWNPFLDHQSGWLPEDFEKRGYKVYPLLGIRFRGRNNWFFTIILYILAIIFRPILWLFPTQLCNGFAAVKKF